MDEPVSHSGRYQLSMHAQICMDLRGITTADLEYALGNAFSEYQAKGGDLVSTATLPDGRTVKVRRRPRNGESVMIVDAYIGVS